MLQTLVMKFGGTSVGSGPAISQAVEVVKRARGELAKHVVAVVSAMSGVTDLLQAGTLSAASGDASRYREIAAVLRQKHGQAAKMLLAQDAASAMQEIEGLIDGYTLFCDSVRVLGEATPRALDHTMGLGERMSARLVAAALRKAGLPSGAVDATRLIVTDERFQNATPVPELTVEKVRQVLNPLLYRGDIPVVTGFIGATQAGVSTTLGRGGSDYTATLIGACLGSDEVWILTDVDGVMSADPRIVPEAHCVDSLSYREVSELAYFGAKVLHPKSIRPLLETAIPLRVKNTFDPGHPGTLVRSNDTACDGVKAVTAISHVSLITVEGKGMLGVPGIAARTFSAVAQAGTSVLLISQASSEQSICLAVPQETAEMVAAAVSEGFERELVRRDIDRVHVQGDVTIVTVVGEGIRRNPRIAQRIFTATGQAGIDLIAIAQGSSDCGISLVVSAHQGEEALRAIHELTLNDRGSTTRKGASAREAK